MNKLKKIRELGCGTSCREYEQKQVISVQRDTRTKGIVELMTDYENAKMHFFRCSQAYHPDKNVVQRALDAYMTASNKYHQAKFSIRGLKK